MILFHISHHGYWQVYSLMNFIFEKEIMSKILKRTWDWKNSYLKKKKKLKKLKIIPIKEWLNLHENKVISKISFSFLWNEKKRFNRTHFANDYVEIFRYYLNYCGQLEIYACFFGGLIYKRQTGRIVCNIFETITHYTEQKTYNSWTDDLELTEDDIVQLVHTEKKDEDTSDDKMETPTQGTSTNSCRSISDFWKNTLVCPGTRCDYHK